MARSTQIIVFLLSILYVSCIEIEDEFSVIGTWHFADETDWVFINDTLVFNEAGSFYSHEIHGVKWMDTAYYNLIRYGRYAIISSSKIKFTTFTLEFADGHKEDTLISDTLIYHQCDNEYLYIDSFYWKDNELWRLTKL